MDSGDGVDSGADSGAGVDSGLRSVAGADTGLCSGAGVDVAQTHNARAIVDSAMLSGLSSGISLSRAGSGT